MSEHSHPRESLGAFALGHLDDAERALVQAHLDGCAECRAEVAEIAPLRAHLDRLDPEVFATAPTPPPDLGDRLFAALADERAVRDADELAARRRVGRDRASSRVRLGVAAAALVLLAGLGGAVAGRASAPEPPVAAPVPTEQIALTPVSGAPVEIDSAVLVNHTWGTELRMQAEGFADGEVFRAAFHREDGTWVPAGEFRGVGGKLMTCNLQSSVLRADVDEVVLFDAAGEPVAEAPLPAT